MVSNYYRPGSGELWPTTPAIAYALVDHGKVTGYVVTDGGSGYTTPPTITVRGIPSPPGKVQLAFTTHSRTNGSVASIQPPSAPK